MSEQPGSADRAESAQDVEKEGRTPDATRTRGEEQVDDAVGGADFPGDGA